MMLLCVQAFVPSPRLNSLGGGSALVSTPPSQIIAQQQQQQQQHRQYRQYQQHDKMNNIPAALRRQRKSVAPVQTMGLFGLGVPEIGVILIAAAFLLGPQKLAELGKDAGKIAGELKEVPKEFQKGLEEGEKQAKLMKAEGAKAAPTEEKKEE
ncbi:hypothetical protein ACA910_012783 [Epithemia clementina (nom. ined.)]